MIAVVGGEHVTLKRLMIGEAVYVGGVIPESIRPELCARRRFIELVLEGKSSKAAEEQASSEAHEKTMQALTKGGGGK